jgi:hypothetical protein
MQNPFLVSEIIPGALVMVFNTPEVEHGVHIGIVDLDNLQP